MDEVMLSNLTFCRLGMGGELVMSGGVGSGATQGRFFNNAHETFANTPNREGWCRFVAGFK